MSSHDNYPFDYRSTSLAEVNGDGGGIPQSVGLAAQINDYKKPLWLCVQTFESGNWLMPSARELRTQVYTSIVSGATGIIYFAMDSLFTRAGGVVGMGPRELLNESYFDSGDTTQPGGPWGHHHASPSLLEMAASAWEATASVNAELLRLMPALFAPTVSTPYSVSFHGANTSSTPIRTLRKHVHAPGHEWDGHDILIAVNIDRARNTAKFDIADASGGCGSSQALFEDRALLPVLNGSFIDEFEEMDTHVYLLPRCKPTLTALKQDDDADGTTVTVSWDTVLKRTNAVPTYLDQVNPLAARGAPTHDAVFDRIRELGAENVRYLHWDANGQCCDFGENFSVADPFVEDFMAASKGHQSVINFAAPPKSFTHPCPNPPTCTNAGFLDPTGVAAGEYFSRLISWYTKGGFVDERNVFHKSNHKFDWKLWEVLNVRVPSI